MLGSRRDPKPPTATGQLSYRVPPPVTSHGAVSQSSSGDWMTRTTSSMYMYLLLDGSYLISHLSQVQSNTFSRITTQHVFSPHTCTYLTTLQLHTTSILHLHLVPHRVVSLQ